jgi:hypothetical protein
MATGSVSGAGERALRQPLERGGVERGLDRRLEIDAARRVRRVEAAAGAAEDGAGVARLGRRPPGQERGEDLLLGVVLAGGEVDEAALADDEVVGSLARQEPDLDQIEAGDGRPVLLGPRLADQLLDVAVVEGLAAEVLLELARREQQVGEQLGVRALVEEVTGLARALEHVGERDGLAGQAAQLVLAQVLAQRAHLRGAIVGHGGDTGDRELAHQRADLLDALPHQLAGVDLALLDRLLLAVGHAGRRAVSDGERVGRVRPRHEQRGGVLAERTAARRHARATSAHALVLEEDLHLVRARAGGVGEELVLVAREVRQPALVGDARALGQLAGVGDDLAQLLEAELGDVARFTRVTRLRHGRLLRRARG